MLFGNYRKRLFLSAQQICINTSCHFVTWKKQTLKTPSEDGPLVEERPTNPRSRTTAEFEKVRDQLIEVKTQPDAGQVTDTWPSLPTITQQEVKKGQPFVTKVWMKAESGFPHSESVVTASESVVTAASYQ